MANGADMQLRVFLVSSVDTSEEGYSWATGYSVICL